MGIKLEAVKVAKPEPVQQTATLDEVVRQAYLQGYEKGFKEAAGPTSDSIYAAVLVAAGELYGFGPVRGVRLLKRVDHHLMHTFTSMEMVQQAAEEIGVEIRSGDPFEPVKLIRKRRRRK